MKDTYFLTTAIDYTNAAPHIGHAYEKTLADVLARYARLRGEKVYFLTGVDQHGQKGPAVRRAGRGGPAGSSPNVTRSCSATSTASSTSPTTAGRRRPTRATSASSSACCKALFDSGQIYKGPLRGPLQRPPGAVPDRQGAQRGNRRVRPGNGAEVVYLEEENYYFKLSEHRGLAARLPGTTRELHHPTIPRGGRGQRGAEDLRGPVHLPPEGAPRVGHRAAVRRPIRHLRLV